jgi:hypothetical protein
MKRLPLDLSSQADGSGVVRSTNCGNFVRHIQRLFPPSVQGFQCLGTRGGICVHSVCREEGTRMEPAEQMEEA